MAWFSLVALCHPEAEMEWKTTDPCNTCDTRALTSLRSFCAPFVFLLSLLVYHVIGPQGDVQYCTLAKQIFITIQDKYLEFTTPSQPIPLSFTGIKCHTSAESSEKTPQSPLATAVRPALTPVIYTEAEDLIRG